MLIDMLLIMITLAVLFQPNAGRLYAALVFVAVTWGFQFVSWKYDLHGFKYCATAALSASLIIALISGIDPIPKMVVRLQAICGLSIFCNLFAWLGWLTPDIYEFLFFIIYALVLLNLIERNPDAVHGGFRINQWRSCFHYGFISRIGINCKNTTEI